MKSILKHLATLFCLFFLFPVYVFALPLYHSTVGVIAEVTNISGDASMLYVETGTNEIVDVFTDGHSAYAAYEAFARTDPGPGTIEFLQVGDTLDAFAFVDSSAEPSRWDGLWRTPIIHPLSVLHPR